MSNTAKGVEAPLRRTGVPDATKHGLRENRAARSLIRPSELPTMRLPPRDRSVRHRTTLAASSRRAPEAKMTRPPREEFKVEPLPDLRSARDDWIRLAKQSDNVFGTWEWADAWCSHLGTRIQPALAVARRDDGEAAAILPLCVVRDRPLRLVRFVGAGPSDELGPVCAPADRAAAAIALRRHVGQTLGRSGLFVGERLPGEDNLGPQLGAVALQRAASPVLAVSERSFDEFLGSRSRNFRDQVRRHERKLAREYRLVYRLTQSSRLESDMKTLIQLHHARWSQGQSSTFSRERASFHLDFARRAIEHGWLRLWIMELDDTAVAAWYGMRYGGIEFYYQAGRDPAFADRNVGFVLLCHTIRCAFEDGMREYRFGRGNDPYKNRFAERDPGLDTVAITAGARGRLALAAIRAALRTPGPMRGLTWRLGAGKAGS